MTSALILAAAAGLAAALTVDVGGVLAVPLPENALSARYDDQEALVVAGHAIVGVPVDAAPGPRRLTASLPNGAREIEFTVVAREFPEERLTIANPRLVNPLSSDLERHARERAVQDAAYALRTPPRQDLTPFEQPVQGRLSSVFGHRRVFNGQPRARHSGLDIAAPVGTPVKAPAPATVAAVGDYFFNGKTVLLDHGGGLVSMLCHLHRIDVAEGVEVARGQVVAAVGSTGRSTGPHLHWTVSLLGTRVDPQQAMAVLNALVDAE